MKKALFTIALGLASCVTYGQQEGKELVTIPAGVNTYSVSIHGLSIVSSGEKTWEGQMGIDGDEVYVKGLCMGFPESWVKGSMNQSKTVVTFPSCQYLGSTEGEYGRDIWFEERSMKQDFVMAWDEETKTLSCGETSGYIENTSLSTVSFLDEYCRVTITPQQSPLSIRSVNDASTEVFNIFGLRKSSTEKGITIYQKGGRHELRLY